MEEEKDKDWYLKITRVLNGYVLEGDSGEDFIQKTVIEDKEEDELSSHEKLLWEVMEYFNLGGTKHDKERIKVVREKNE